MFTDPWHGNTPISERMVFSKPVYHMLCYESVKVVKSSVEKTENT